RCTTEWILWQQATLLKVEKGQYTLGKEWEYIPFEYQGSIKIAAIWRKDPAMMTHPIPSNKS
ncbi:MAG: hypothetical protein ACO331_15100, partial [Prochlorothrix sp.]